MAAKCPKCDFDNTSDSKFCKECGTQLSSTQDASFSPTKTLVTPIQKLIPGSIFAGRYEIIKELGRGRMGIVYQAKDSKLQRIVALKFLPFEWAYDSQAKERFSREAQAAAALDHPNICAVHEIDEAEGSGDGEKGCGANGHCA
jgi:serine/threonine protein kinase